MSNISDATLERMIVKILDTQDYLQSFNTILENLYDKIEDIDSKLTKEPPTIADQWRGNV